MAFDIIYDTATKLKKLDHVKGNKSKRIGYRESSYNTIKSAI